jgi:hypothetical protein
MPRFIYTGTHRDNPAASDANEADHTVAFGVTFPRGVAVEVTDQTVVRKLVGNPYFRALPVEPIVPPTPVVLPVDAPEIGASQAEPAVDTPRGGQTYDAAPNALLGGPKKNARRKSKG